MAETLTLDRVYQAAHALKNTIRKTDLIRADNIAEHCDLYLKTENLQITGSFKVRGAGFKMHALTPEERAKGVVACSAGNHAQGVALAAMKTGTEATIFLPSSAPISKVEATRQMGAKIMLIDGVYDDAHAAAMAYQRETGKIFIHPFDDYDVIAGQGTIGLELLDQLSGVEAIVVPVGGGGLASGVAFVAKMLNPDVKVYGVQAVGAGSMCNAFENKELCSLSQVSTFADGIAVKSPGKITYEMCRRYVDDMIAVTDDEIALAVLWLMERQKLVTEGAGAVSVAAVLFEKLPLAGKKVCAIVSGGNIDVNILSKVIHRGLLTSGRRTDLTIEMLDKPGQLLEVASIIAKTGANVTMVEHNLGTENMDINGVYLHIAMETRNFEHLNEIKEKLMAAGYNMHENK